MQNKKRRKEKIMTNTSNNIFISASEVQKTMGVSRSYAYKIVKKLNEELESKGFLTIDGRTSRCYFNERFYGLAV